MRSQRKRHTLLALYLTQNFPRFAAIVTDGDLNPLDEGVQWVVRTDKAILDGMDEW